MESVATVVQSGDWQDKGDDQTAAVSRGAVSSLIDLALAHAAVRSASKRLSQPSSWFQLAKMRLTSPRSGFSRRLSAGAVAKRRVGGPHARRETTAGKPLKPALWFLAEAARFSTLTFSVDRRKCHSPESSQPFRARLTSQSDGPRFDYLEAWLNPNASFTSSRALTLQPPPS